MGSSWSKRNWVSTDKVIFVLECHILAFWWIFYFPISINRLWTPYKAGMKKSWIFEIFLHIFWANICFYYLHNIQIFDILLIWVSPLWCLKKTIWDCIYWNSHEKKCVSDPKCIMFCPSQKKHIEEKREKILDLRRLSLFFPFSFLFPHSTTAFLQTIVFQIFQ